MYLYRLQNHKNCLHRSTNPLFNIGINTTEYIPFFCLNFGNHPGLPVHDLLAGNMQPDEFDRLYGGGSWKTNEPLTKFLTKCVENGYYNVLLLANFGFDYPTVDTFITHVIRDMGQWLHVSNSCLSDNLSVPSLIVGQSDIFECVKYSSGWTMHKGVMKYVTNTLFLGSTTANMLDIKPLFCVMVKKEDAAYVKTCFITNTAIPSSMLHLWVDESVEANGSKIKPLFRKVVKSKLQASGVTITYFDNLGEKIVRRLMIPLNTTVEQLESWKNGLVQGMYEANRNNTIFNKDISFNEGRIKEVLSEFEASLRNLAKEV